MPATWQIARALWGFGLGTAFLLMIFLIFWNGRWRPAVGDSIPELDPTPEPYGVVSDFPEGLQEAHGGVTSFIKWFIVVYAIWVVGYVTIFILASTGKVYLPPITAAPYSEAIDRTLPLWLGP